jgi:hypothetical protein
MWAALTGSLLLSILTIHILNVATCDGIETLPPMDNNYSIDIRMGHWKQSNVTFVTALYDIGRADRSYSTYKKWTVMTLQSPQPFIIFCRKEDVHWIVHSRIGKETLIIAEDKIPLEYLVERTRDVMQIVGNGRPSPEWVNERYIPLQFSKAIWLQRAMARNPFKSHSFFWIDAGLARFFGQTNQSFGLSRNEAELEPGRVYISLGKPLAHLALDPIPAIGSQDAYLAGGFFGGNIMPLTRVCNALIDFLHKEMLDKGRLDNEQVAFHHIYAKHETWFHVLDRSAQGCGFICM